MPTVIPSAQARYFSRLPNEQKGIPAFQYIWDSGVVWQDQAGNLITGAERPVVPSDLASSTTIDVSGGLSVSVGNVAVTGGSITVNNTAPIPISGVVVSSPSPIQAVSGYVSVLGGNSAPLNVTGIINTVVTGAVSASFDTTSIVLAQVTGNERLLVADQLLSGISGQNTTIQNQLGGTLNVSVVNGVVPVSGVVTTTVSVGNVTVTGFPSTIAPLAISGVVQASVSADNTDVVLAVSSGNAYGLMSNILLSGVSGTLSANLDSAAYVTGQVGITNTAPLAVSGVTQANITNSVLTTQVTGFYTGAVVLTDVRSSSTAGNSTPSGASPFNGATFFWGQALAANANRAELFVQNIHTGTPLYVNLGSVAASTGSFSMILNPSTQLNWGGTSWGSRSWRGAVQVSGAAWIAWEV